MGQRNQFAIDAVLIDFNMPRMNGPLTIVALRKIGFRGPVIGVSGGDDKTMKEFLKAGADDVIQKPAKADVLVGMLLTGLHRVVLEKSGGTSHHATLTRDGSNIDETKRESEMAEQEHVTRLKKFLEGIQAKAQVAKH